jgi:hypothetical protein
MTRILACMLLLACGGDKAEEREPFVEDTAPPAGTAELKQACYEACDVRYISADGCPPATSEDLRDACLDLCSAEAAQRVVTCLAESEAYYACVEAQDWLCAQGEDEPRLLDDTACVAETAAYEACPV